MKQLLLLAALFAASCTSTPSIPKVQVEYEDGIIENVSNPKNILIKLGDSLIIQHYSSLVTLYSTREIDGKYRGKLPSNTIDSSYVMTYHMAVVVRVHNQK